MSHRRTGSLVGAIGGLVFILVNAGALDGALAVAVRLAGVLAFLAVAAPLMSRRDTESSRAAPGPRAWRTYWSMVMLEGVLLLGGSMIIARTPHPELGVAWVALIVGAHFLPFAKAFEVPVFRLLGWTMVCLGVLGAVLAVTVDAAAGAGVAGVLSGVAMLAFAFSAGRSDRERIRRLPATRWSTARSR